MDTDYFKILAIDDFPDNLTSIKALVTEAFPMAEVYLADGGKKGLELANTILPDIILLDIVMPVIDGYEVCSKIKDDSKLADTPVIFLTALKGDRENRIKALEAGGDAFLAKPIDEIELIAQIRAMLKIRNSNLKNRDEKAWLEMLVATRTKALEKELIERKIAVKTALENEEKFSKAFQTSPYMLIITRVADGRIIEVNKAYCKTSGYTREEAMGSSTLMLHLWKNPEERVKVVEALLSGKNVIGWEIEFCGKSGEQIVGSVSSQILNLENQKCIITSIEDITEKKRLKKLVEQSNERYRIVSDRMSDFTFSCVETDGAYQIDWLTGAVKKVTGYSIEEVILKKCWGYMVYPDDFPVFRNNVIALNPGDETKCELRIVTPDNQINWLEVTTACLKNSENNNVIYGGCVDITRRKNTELNLKQSEEKFRNVFEAANVGKSITEISGKINVNQAFCDMLGYQKEELQHKTWMELTPPEEITAIQEILQPLLKGEIKSQRFNKRYIRKNGTYIWCDVSVVIQRDETGRPLNFITNVIDISERIKAETDLKHNIDLLSKFIDHSPIHAYIKEVTPTQSYVLYASNNYVKMIGIKGSDMIGKNMYQLFPPEFAEKITADDWSVVSDGIDLKMDESLNGNDYITYKFPIGQGNKRLLAGYSIDITDRTIMERKIKESEALMKSIFTASPVGVGLFKIG